jgi:hypothetical protein
MAVSQYVPEFRKGAITKKPPRQHLGFFIFYFYQLVRVRTE